ncbi:TRAP transporter large permease subunit [Microvirga alba]|uniref:TRAP transporter large permease subunit n=1 Tax=Microvirga alba TaxID=2791025 RepID=A0A931BNK6_9HYPH|nr:TRAP transporter large permease subunit [Microvirga alba]MBF9234116.1 TRAP transporter large permease subunit [Microvirga alba]
MAWVGLALLPLIGLALILTGLPAFIVLIGASGLGALAAAWSGSGGLLSALPARLTNLFENDLLQALPLFVLMGALLNRLPLADILFRTGTGLMRGSPSGPQVTSIGLGALLAPMNGSVGASIAVLSRTVGPKLVKHGVEPADGLATIAVASTLGVVVPPSLVLILLGDAMMAAHTIASNTMGRSERIINTQDIFRGVMGPAVLFVLLCLAVAAWKGGRTKLSVAIGTSSSIDRIVSIGTIAFIVALLGGVTVGLFYPVEAAAMGAVTLLVGGLLTGYLNRQALMGVLAEALAITGALFALLVAATTFTLVVRCLGTDRLLGQLIADLPGGELGATLVVLGILALSAFVLDVFEIIFVVIPIVMPALLMRVGDAVWVSALTILTLQASFLLPPLGYAVMIARGTTAEVVPIRNLMRALRPFLIAQATVLSLTAAVPAFVHLNGQPQKTTSALAVSEKDVLDKLNQLAPAGPLEVPSLNLD